MHHSFCYEFGENGFQRAARFEIRANEIAWSEGEQEES
jgi:hypothetical protein